MAAPGLLKMAVTWPRTLLADGLRMFAISASVWPSTMAVRIQGAGLRRAVSRPVEVPIWAIGLSFDAKIRQPADAVGERLQ